MFVFGNILEPLADHSYFATKELQRPTFIHIRAQSGHWITFFRCSMGVVVFANKINILLASTVLTFTVSVTNPSIPRLPFANGKEELRRAKVCLRCSMQVKSFNRAQGNPQIFKFHTDQPMALLHPRHTFPTRDKPFETNFRGPFRKLK